MCNFIESMRNTGPSICQTRFSWHIITVVRGGIQATVELRYRTEKRQPWGFSSLCLLQIAEHVDSTDGFLSKLSLYKALALVAFAQQGKQPSGKLLENCIQGGREKRLSKAVLQCELMSCYEATCHHLAGSCTILANGISCACVLPELWS